MLKLLKLSFAILFLIIAINVRAEVYPTELTPAKAHIMGNLDAENCFDANGNPYFDDLYYYARIWQERQDTNYYVLASISKAELQNKKIENINLDYVVADSSNKNLLWYVEPLVKCSVEVRQTYYQVQYIAEQDKFGTTTCNPQVYATPLANSTQYLYLDYNSNLPDSTSKILTQSDTCSCSWTTSQGFNIHNYYDYDYLATTYHWINTPDTLVDTVGCIVMHINRQLFNQHLEGQDRIGMGELNYFDGAVQWLSPTDTAFVPHTMGGGKNVAKMYWQKDTICDTFYWDNNYSKDTVFTVFRYNPRITAYQYANRTTATAALSERNSRIKSSVTVTHADVLHYIATDNGYQLESRWDGKIQGIPEIKATNKKIYFSGKLVPATIIGHNSANDITRSTFTGAAAGNGDGPATIYIHNRGKNDLYFNNFQLGTAALTVDEDEPTSMFDKLPRKYLSAAITLEGNGQDSYIHFRGNNYLCGNYGRPTITTLYSAAIYMNVNETDFQSLTFDDIWADNTHTHGVLQLEGNADDNIGNSQSTNHRQASPIYSGNKRTSITFNGGQYKFAAADNITSNRNFMVVSRRRYKTPLVNYVFPDVGSDVGDGLVYIKDGSFSLVAPQLTSPINYPEFLANGTHFDKQYYVMYMPERTYITGGSFENCIVKVTDGDASAPDCTGTITCPSNGIDTLFQYYIPCLVSGDSVYPDWNSEPDCKYDNYSFASTTVSFNPYFSEYYISPYLPSKSNINCDNAEYGNKQNWDILFPSGVVADFQSENRSLLVNIKRNNGEPLTGTNYFGICEINPYYPSRQNYILPNLTEPADYQIDKHIYMLTWTMADKWRVKTMPFDVSHINLISTWATDARGNTPDPDLEWDYYKKTFQTIIVRGRLSELRNELGIDAPFWSLYQRAVTTRRPDTTRAGGTTTQIMPQVARQQQELYYYGQGNDLNPSFYLFEAVNYFLPDGRFCQAWKIPQPDSNGIIMHKGRTYAWLFPNTVDEGEDGYNFWNGKYIVLEGDGQTLSGVQSNISYIPDGNILITGNNTFNVHRNASFQRYEWNYEHQQFERHNSTSVYWAESYIVGSNTTWDETNLFDIDCLLHPDTSQSAIINETFNNTVEIYTTNNHLTIQSHKDQFIRLYNTSGKLIFGSILSAEILQTIYLPTGIYLICDENLQSQKIVIF